MKLQGVLRCSLIAGVFVLSFQGFFRDVPVASGQMVPNANGRRHVLQVAKGWSVYRGVDGLVIFHPRGWKVQPRGKGAFAVYNRGLNGETEAVALVQPLSPIQGPAAGPVEHIGQVFPDVLANARVSNLRSTSRKPEVVIADLHRRSGGISLKGSAMCFKQGRQGVVYAMAANEANWQRAEPVLKRILSGFFYAGTGSGRNNPHQRTALPQMVPWRDPVENAFTCPVPRGWKVEGGLRRFTAVDVRPEIVTTSPDGRVLVRFGDAGIPTMTVNSSMLASTGFQEGSWYSSDGLNKWLVMRYLPGYHFLSEYYLPNRFQHFKITSQQDLPEISRVMANTLSQAGIQAQVNAGQLHFEVQDEGGLRKGFAFAQTAFAPLPTMPDTGSWNVISIFGYLAAPGQEALGEEVLQHMVRGYRIDPRWQAMQNRTVGRVARINSDTNREINDIIARVFENRSASEDRMAAQRSRAILGQVLIQDPERGEKFEVPGGSDYYWRRGGTNTFIGTDSPDRPGYWLREMKILD